MATKPLIAVSCGDEVFPLQVFNLLSRTSQYGRLHASEAQCNGEMSRTVAMPYSDQRARCRNAQRYKLAIGEDDRSPLLQVRRLSNNRTAGADASCR